MSRFDCYPEISSLSAARRCFFCLLLFFYAWDSVAQEAGPQVPPTTNAKQVAYAVVVSPIYAWMHAHSDRLALAYKGTTGRGFQIDLNRRRKDDMAFDFSGIAYHSGYTLQYLKFSHEDLDQALNVGYFLEPILIDKPKFSLGFKATVGLNYASNPWNANTNPDNYAYSLPINIYLGLGLHTHIVLTNNQSLQAFATYGHISNGNINSPNNGLNYPFVGIGYERFLAQKTRPKSRMFFNAQRWRFDLGVLASNKSLPNFKEMRFWAHGLTVNAAVKTGDLHAWTLGMEAFRDGSIAFLLNNDSDDAPFKLGTRLGLLGGHEFLLNRWIFSQQLGYYLRHDVFTTKVYQRFGIHYKVTQQLNVGLNINAILPRAYMSDIRLLYSFYK